MLPQARGQCSYRKRVKRIHVKIISKATSGGYGADRCSGIKTNREVGDNKVRTGKTIMKCPKYMCIIGLADHNC